MNDESGISGEVFKLALAAIVMAAILAILANMLSSVRESGQETINNTGDAMVALSKKLLNETKNF
jgi:hypothetical protein